MDDIYQWLYDNYALPQLKALMTGQDDILDQLAERLPLQRQERRRMLDTAENLRLQWGTEAFALGVRFGQELTAPRPIDEDCRWLLDLLPQLDNTVT